jgi:hypothetical protein
LRGQCDKLNQSSYLSAGPVDDARSTFVQFAGIGALAGLGGSALYTYKLRKRTPRY